ncbi:MAG TPA: GH92 family glycosyl hydrolase [Verrucomicrobiae bacterium]|nr:GH92 family glycosyl hydrolase [Verrucomicrobiae bacterium]
MYNRCPHQPCPIKLPILASVAGAMMGLCLPLRAYPLQNLTTNVCPLNGTANGGNTFPGAVAPFGMVQWSPDTTTLDQPGGYVYSDTRIIGFSLDHFSGAGGLYGGDFAFTPILGGVTNSPVNRGDNGKAAFPSTFFHTNEIARPGYYSVQFTNGIRTELTVTTRTGFGRFTFPPGGPASLVINACSEEAKAVNASIRINPDDREIRGWTTQAGFCGRSQPVTLYFDAVFDHAFDTYGVWSGGTLTPNGTNADGSQIGSYLGFNLPGGGVVLARTGVSFVSLANARSNLRSESQGSSFSSAGFDDAANAAGSRWNNYLNRIQITGGTPEDRQTFYTMMYHALLDPGVVSDVNGDYIGFDGLTHTVPAGHEKYEFFSGWDIYRSECQLLAMVDPARAGDMAQSLVLDARQGGAMPRWSLPTGDNGCMLGDPATAIISGMYAFGATNFDTRAALAAMVNAATNPALTALNGVAERDAERDYLDLGYVPTGEIGGWGGPVSMTLEYDSADFALARFAKALGDTANYAAAMDRAQNWRNLFNADSRYLQKRDSVGRWTPGFPIYEGFNSTYVEGTAYQYVWMVPFNFGSLIALMGGPEVAAGRLDKFFTQLNDPDETYSPYAYMGNEPCSETPWIYAFLGKPYRTSSVVRKCVTEIYSSGPGGLPGNDDLGQMGAWYVFAALGMYPEIPGDDVLTLAGPLFPQAVVHLANGDLTITGNGAADDAPYVQSATEDGRDLNAPWIRFADIASGGTLAFTMGTIANTNWGSDPSVAPPSYRDGMTSPLAPDCVWGTGLEPNDPQPTSVNTVDAMSPGGGISDVGPIMEGLAGPELGVRSENSQSGTHEIMYSGGALGGAADFAYMKAFDVSDRNIIIKPGMHFSYWIFPQSANGNGMVGMVTGSNSACVAMDIIFKDGTTLRNSGLTNQYGDRMAPSAQAGHLALDTWNYVTVDLTPLAGKAVNRIDVGYDHPDSFGGYRGYLDDISFTTPASGFTNNQTLPTVPANLQAAGGYELVSLNWARVASATSYTIARSTSSGAEKMIANTLDTRYTDPGLTNGTTYYYVVSARNILGSSENSSEVNAAPAAPAPNSYAAAVFADNPMAYWPLGETNGSIAFDRAGGNNGAYVGGFSLGQPGVPLPGFGPNHSVRFDGTSGLVDVPDGPFDVTNAITMVAWVKVPVAPRQFAGIIGHGDSSWRMSVNTGGMPSAADGGGGDATSPTSIVGANWHMVAYTYTGLPNAANNGSLYVDGVLQAKNTVGALSGNDMDVRIAGAPDYAAARMFCGNIAQVSIFTNALSAEQVEALYNAGTNSLPLGTNH